MRAVKAQQYAPVAEEYRREQRPPGVPVNLVEVVGVLDPGKGVHRLLCSIDRSHPGLLVFQFPCPDNVCVIRNSYSTQP